MKKKRKKTDEGIKVKHGLTFQALRRIYSELEFNMARVNKVFLTLLTRRTPADSSFIFKTDWDTLWK